VRHYKILELQNKIQRLGIRPLDVLVVGVTGAGKSTTLNSVFGNNIVKIGEGVDPETMDVSAHSLNDYRVHPLVAGYHKL
jgi:predicted GTPase